MIDETYNELGKKDKLYEATKKEVMTEEEEYRNADVPMPKKQELDKDFIEHLEKFFKGKKIIDSK